MDETLKTSSYYGVKKVGFQTSSIAGTVKSYHCLHWDTFHSFFDTDLLHYSHHSPCCAGIQPFSLPRLYINKLLMQLALMLCCCTLTGVFRIATINWISSS